MSLEFGKIYHEDCLETLSRMTDDSVDLVITSPPYNMNLRISTNPKTGEARYHSRQVVKEISTKYLDEFSDNLPIDEFYELHSNILRELLRVSDLVFYNIQIVTGSKRAFFKMIGEFAENLKDIIVWDKRYAQPAIQEHVLNRVSELILVFEKDFPISRQYRKRGRFARGTLDDIWTINRQSGKKINGVSHGASFPEELVERILLNFSDEGNVVYDPFLGTGTTAVVAERLNRNWLGSEISQAYVDIAQVRLDGDQITATSIPMGLSGCRGELGSLAEHSDSDVGTPSNQPVGERFSLWLRRLLRIER